MKAGGGSKRWALAVALVLALVWWRYVDWLREAPHFQDLNVYRAGARALLDGSALYVDRSAGHGQLVFTYPPFAALVFAPFALLPWAGAAVVLVLLSALGYAVLVGIFGRTLGWTRTGIAVAAGVGLLAEPMLRTIQQGQINLLLAALVAADLLVVPRRYRGILIGIAAGIKLVPAAFGLCLLARRDVGSMARLIATAAGTVVLPMLVAPESTVHFWTHLLLDASRSGGGGYPDNQSLAGVLARVLHDDTPWPPLVLLLQAGALLLAYAVARRAHLAGREAEAVLGVAIGALLASPVSWSHHWVWCVPLGTSLYAARRRVALALAGVVFWFAPLTLSPLGALGDAPRPAWMAATALMPAFGIWWLVTTYANKGDERATTMAGA